MTAAVEFPLIHHQRSPLQEAAPGIFWLRMPLPFRPGIVNIWFLQDGDAWTAIDTGAATPKSNEIWSNAVRSLPGKVGRVIATHSHPDHSGNAGWLQQTFGMTLWISRAEWLLARTIEGQPREKVRSEENNFFRHCDVPEPYLGLLGAGDRAFHYITPIPPVFRRMEHGDDIRIGDDSWRVIVGEGHSPEHASLYCAERRILLSGDQILGRIVSTVRALPNDPQDDQVGRYLRSLKHFDGLDPDTLVLPAHGRPFTGIAARIHALREFYAGRFRHLAAKCDRPMTARECMDESFEPEADLSRLRMLLTETFAQLNTLVARGQLKRTFADDRWLFEPAAPGSGPGFGGLSEEPVA